MSFQFSAISGQPSAGFGRVKSSYGNCIRVWIMPETGRGNKPIPHPCQSWKPMA